MIISFIPSYFLKFLLLIFILIVPSKTGTKTKVEDLFPIYTKDIYSGYLTTLIEDNELFYVFFPSQSDSQPDDPVLLWLNGGPGCSSLFGMLGEIGPVTTDIYSGEFKLNNFTWNQNLNLLFIEQPAGVGFSKTSDMHYNWTDVENAKNLYEGVKDFYRVFPEYKKNIFYISGESYAGIFIPHLANEILEDIDKGAQDVINFGGFMVGNPLTDPEVDYDRCLVEFGYWHGLIGEENFESFERNCPHFPDELDPKSIYNNNKIDEDNDGVTHKCNEARKKISKNFDGNDVYGINRPCTVDLNKGKNEKKCLIILIQKKTLLNENFYKV